MNKSPINHIVTIAIGVVLWVIFGILMASYLSESPNLKDKDATVLAADLRLIFGIGVLLSLFAAAIGTIMVAKKKPQAKCPWQKKVADVILFQLILAIALAVVIILMNMSQEMEAKWFAIYFVLISVLTFILFWATTFLMSPRTVKFVPFGK